MAKAKGYRQGQYTPRHPDKYIGNVANITYRSSWELTFCEFVDNNPNVIRWASEEIAIQYLKPTTGRIHRYFPDFYIEYIDRDGRMIKELIEIKPNKQTTLSTARRHKTRLYEDITLGINRAKWAAAKQWCSTKGVNFRLLTEQQLYKR